MNLPIFQITVPRACDLIWRVLLLSFLALSAAVYVAAEPEGKTDVLSSHVTNKYIDSLGKQLLIDPQRLLSKEDYSDVEAALVEHAKHSRFDLSVLLLEGEQRLANAESFKAEISADLLASRSEVRVSSSSRWAGVVIYYLANPVRNELILVGDEAEVESEVDAVVEEWQSRALALERFNNNKLLNTARRKASEKSNKVTQIHAFLTQLSIGLFWLEEEQAKHVDHRPEDSAIDSGVIANLPEKKVLRAEIDDFLGKYGVFLILVLLLGLLMLYLLLKRNDERVYLFAERTLPERLEAKYAAGVGAAIGFDDHLMSPSDQRDSEICFLSEG